MTMQGTAKEQMLASLLEREGIAAIDRSAIQPRGSSIDAPLSFAQERFWFLDQLEGGSHYNDHLALRIKGGLDKEALERSLDAMVARHETLRTTFVSVEGNPMQHIEKHRPIELTYFDLTVLTAERRESEALRHAASKLKRPFALDQAPAFRLALWRLAPDDHLFLLCIHQIINDGWSLRIFTTELEKFYRSFVNGEEAGLPELPIQYADFAVWQRDQFQGSELATEMAYWKKQLSGELPVLELPLDQPRSSAKTFQGARHSISLTGSLLHSLRSLAQRENATLFMLLLAAFKVLIYRYSGQEDIAVGFPIANRDREETERLMGVFINPLVLRSNLSGEPTFRELLGRVREMALDAYDNQRLPFEILVDALQPDRSSTYPPLFQVLFDYNNVPMPEIDLPNLSITRVDLDAGTAKFDLSLELSETADTIRGFFEYSSEIFDASTIRLIDEHFQCLLEGIAADPDQCVSQLPLMSAAESQKVLIEWNNTEEVYCGPSTIHERFEVQANLTPDQTALIHETRSQTYAELNSFAEKIANLLLRSGINTGSKVGVCIGRSPEMVGCLLGVLKAGCLFVPLDPNYPAKRLEFIINDAELSCLLTESNLVDDLPKTRSTVITIDSDLAHLDSRQAEVRQFANADDGAAYVIYTSGSTGDPKGVVGTYHGSINRFEWMWNRYPFDLGEVCCQKTSLGFVDSIWEIFGPLLRGIPSVIISDAVTRDPDRLIEMLAANKVTRIVAVPSLLEMLLARNENLRHRLPSLKYCVSSGEAISPELCRRFMEALPGTVLLNLYGSSEASADSTYYEITAVDARSQRSIPIGRPIANTQVYILDRKGLPVPTGVPGELHIGGAGVSLGYLNRPEMNQSRFIKDPFRKDSRLFKTGDLGRYLPDGNIQIIGRADDQVKIRGMRVELGEIETKIKQFDQVREAAVVVREDAPGNKTLVAYISSEDGTALEDRLRAFLSEVLPDHMLPAFFVFVESLPKTTSGKIDRRALCNIKEFEPVRSSEKVSPRNEAEQKLTDIWESLLGLNMTSVKDDFFELGGNSLLAVKLFYEIEQVFGKKLPLATLFRASSIEKLADIIHKGDFAARESSIVPIQPNGKKPPFFCVHAAGGNVLFYRDLANRLGNDQPFYGIQARRIGGAQVAHSNVEEMAAFYINEMRTIQPKGPYYLGGASFGGLVAFEMAHQLKAQGEDVAFTALFDTYAPGYPKYLPGSSLLRSRVLSMIGILEQHYDNLRILKPGARWKYVVHRLGKVKHTLWRAKRKYKDIARIEGTLTAVRKGRDQVFGRSRIEPYAAPGMIPGEYRKTEGNIRRALTSYDPRFYAGHVTLFRASKQEKGISPDPTLGWGPLIRELEVREIKGHHGSIVAEPHVQFLAESLRGVLTTAQLGVNAGGKDQLLTAYYGALHNTGTDYVVRSHANVS